MRLGLVRIYVSLELAVTHTRCQKSRQGGSLHGGRGTGCLHPNQAGLVQLAGTQESRRLGSWAGACPLVLTLAGQGGVFHQSQWDGWGQHTLLRDRMDSRAANGAAIGPAVVYNCMRVARTQCGVHLHGSGACAGGRRRGHGTSHKHVALCATTAQAGTLRHTHSQPAAGSPALADGMQQRH